MWYRWDGARILMTHTKTRQKYRNFEHEPRVAVSIADPDDPYRSVEIRGIVETVEDDGNAVFYRSLQQRYGQSYEVDDADVRVIVAIRPERFVAVVGGAIK